MSILDDVVFPRINDFFLGASMNPIRAEIAGQARGHVLEIGAGTGLNFRHYAPDVDVVAIEPGAGMRMRAQQRASENDVRASIRVEDGNAQRLPFDAGSFDTVVATFVFCSVKNIDLALVEIHRVLRPGGTLRLVEHVKSPEPSISRWQRRLRPIWMGLLAGCDPARDVHEALRTAGFDVEDVQTTSLPLPTLVKAGLHGFATKP